MTHAIDLAKTQRETYLSQLKAFLKIPSISTQPDHADDVKTAARWLADEMARIGLENVRVIETKRHPLVVADWLHAGDDKPTVLVYGHYDVQPAEPLDLWQTPPFQPDVRDDYLYARGAADDKGQLFVHVKAVEALLAADGRLPVNVKFIVEGEEESGGASLTAFIPEHKELLAADVALISDTGMVSAEQPAIVYGLRGMTYAFIDVTGPRRDLHSGSFGGGVNNPLNALAHIIAQLQDEDGHVLIPGFYDHVRPLSAEEREILSQFPLDEAGWLAETGAPQPWGEPEFTLVERLGARPTLDVHGIIGGYTDAGAKTVLPSKVHAKVSMRLVPDQDPRHIFELLRDYVAQITPPSVKSEVTLVHTAVPAITDLQIPAMQAAVSAYAAAFGREPVFMREGGSIPVVGDFQAHLGLETILMGFGLPGDNIHAPNERFYLPNFYRGIEASIRFFEAYGAI